MLAGDRHARAAVSAPGIAALGLAGAQQPVIQTHGAFAVAAARTGARPALHVDGTLMVAGDVRLDDRNGLQTRLGISAHDDLALVAAAWRTWGVCAPDHLRGDFSFVVWDGAAQTLLGARDGMGVRPLYYAQTRTALVISNVLDAVRAADGVPSSLHDPAVRSFLERGWNADTTATTFASIRRLAPGTMLAQVGENPLNVRTHWTIPDPEPLSLARDEDYLERYRALLSAAVRDRLEAPSTLILLSGGVDSPTVAAAAAGAAATPVRLLSVTTRASDVEDLTESRLAAAVAARLGIPNELIASETDPRPEAARQTPEPYDDPEFASNSAMLRTLADSASVVFDGEDGDALFAAPGLVPMLRRYPVAAVLMRCLGYTLRFGHHPYMGFWLARRLGLMRDARAVAPTWLTPHARSLADAAEPALPRNRARPEAAARLSGSIWQSVMDGSDRAWHGAPIEVRWPLLDARILEFVFAIPPVPWCQRKHLARRAYAADLPTEVVSRPKTTVGGYHQRLVDGWRARTGANIAPLHERTRELVDPAELGRVLRTGGTEEVLAAWRAVQFDQWIRGARAA